MPSYLSYIRQMAVLDADDTEIESWITVKGNHIPIKKGQSKEDAVKSFLEKKGGSESKVSGEKETRKSLALKIADLVNPDKISKKEYARRMLEGVGAVKPYSLGDLKKEYERRKEDAEKKGGEEKTGTYKYKKGEKVEFYTDVMHDDLAKGKIVGFERSMASHGNKAENQYVIEMPDGSTRTINEKQIDWVKEKVDNGKNSGKVYKNTMSKIRSFKAESDGTYDFETGKPKDYPNGFSVSFHQNEPDEKGNWKSDYGRYSESDYDKNVETLVNESGGELNIGYFAGTPEVSVWVKDRKSAIALMKKHNQHSIWDWEKGEIIENADYDPKKNPMKQ